MRSLLAALLSIASATIVTGTAWSWGNAPTHFSMGYDIVWSEPLPAGIDPDLFIRAHACPDIANTQLFQSRGFGFVHTPEFAEALHDTANARGNDDWRAIALAWGAHLMEDMAGHSTPGHPSYIPPDNPLHSLVEISVDTILLYTFYKGDPPPREQVNVTVASCDPRLIRDASLLYRQRHPDGKGIWSWQSWWAIQSLATSIEAEYGYIEAKGNSRLSEAFLADLYRKGVLPSASFLPYYDASVTGAIEWIRAHP